MSYHCLGCCRFVRSPVATCGSCGQVHSRDSRASEEPIGWRRKTNRNLGWGRR